DGFASSINLAPHERELDPLRITAAQVFPTGHRVLDLELSRLIAMLTIDNNELLSKVLAQLTDDSHPVDDLHYLAVAARMPCSPVKQDRAVIVKSLVGMAGKLAARKLQQDNNWNDRVSELFGQLVDRDPQLPEALIAAPGFGRPQHVVFLSRL